MADAGAAQGGRASSWRVPRARDGRTEKPKLEHKRDKRALGYRLPPGLARLRMLETYLAGNLRPCARLRVEAA
ncbi:hypothetical protein GCM10017667_40940 [Streptomyces filamentosus]|uniref:Uncharacterized protein n=1 Tax=Streptomyces filamentosus TaxID=67294 RepID=A0A919BQ46_STRFL|nr:hypothetical protein GCM10017667_40940 [Streptomyces filamentosus]